MTLGFQSGDSLRALPPLVCSRCAPRVIALANSAKIRNLDVLLRVEASGTIG